MDKSKLLAAVTLILAAGAANGTSLKSAAQDRSEEAAQVLKELTEAGYIRVDPATGRLVLQNSVLDLLIELGISGKGDHSLLASAGCHKTTGGACGGTR